MTIKCLGKKMLAALIMLTATSGAFADDAPTSVTVSVSELGMATYAPTYGLDFTNATSIAAYKAVMQADSICFVKVDTVARGEGVLLKSIDGGAATDVIPVNVAAKAAEDNEFIGTLKDITITEGYILYDVNGAAKFVKVNSKGNTVPANRAYLPNTVKFLPKSDTLKVGELGMATYAPTYGLDFSKATSIAAYKAVMQADSICFVKVDTVARGEGVLLKSIDGGAATDVIPVNVAAKAAEDNEFIGTLKDITITEGYILYDVNGAAKFVKVNSKGNTVLANRAYLPNTVKFLPKSDTLKVGELGMATYAPTYGLDFSKATKIAAYKAVMQEGSLNFVKVDTVARGEGVLLYSINKSSATEAIPVNVSAKAAEDNAFIGTLDSITITEGYILYNVNGAAKFVKVNSEGNIVPANRAYLPDSVSFVSDNNSKLIDLFTGIYEIKAAEKADKVYYNINGQRVQRPTRKGLYIVNGKKIIIK